AERRRPGKTMRESSPGPGNGPGVSWSRSSWGSGDRGPAAAGPHAGPGAEGVAARVGVVGSAKRPGDAGGARSAIDPARQRVASRPQVVTITHGPADSPPPTRDFGSMKALLLAVPLLLLALPPARGGAEPTPQAAQKPDDPFRTFL